MSHPSHVFILSDGAKAEKLRYYTDAVEAAKAIARMDGWTLGSRGPSFGRLTVLFSDRGELDLTRLAKAHGEEIMTGLKAAGLSYRYGGLPRDWEWRDLKDERKAFDALRSRVRANLRAELEAAVTAHREKLTVAEEKSARALKDRLRDRIIAAVSAELDS